LCVEAIAKQEQSFLSA